MMRIIRPIRGTAGRLSLGFAIAAATAVAAVTAAHPAAAAGALAALENAVTCSSTSACYLATNDSTGPGVAGTSVKGIGMQGKGLTGVKGIATTNYGIQGLSTSSYGVFGSSTSGAAGVAGTTASGIGVYGFTTATNFGYGVSGKAFNGYGVYGTTSTPDGIGVGGQETGTTGAGVYGLNDSGYGVEGISGTGRALAGFATGAGGVAAFLEAESGSGLVAYTDTYSGVSIYGNNGAGNAADLTATNIGVVAHTPSLGYSFVGTDSGGTNDEFWVDGGGNVGYHGTLYHFAKVPGGATVKSYTADTAAPTMEDTGTAQLVGGAAVVRLDPTFAASIDAASSYRVFVTPNGDTHGLFVAAKTANGFVVRESQGGRSTVSFDYRIVATAAGSAGVRMAVANPGAEPRAVAMSLPRSAQPTRVAAPPISGSRP